MNLNDREFLRVLGNRLRERCLAQRWTQEDLGRRCALHRTFIGSVERGERNLWLLNLRLIARVLRVTFGEVFADLK